MSNDVRASACRPSRFPIAAIPTRQLIVFAVNTYDRWSNASTNEFDIYVDVDNDGVATTIVVGADQGAVQTGVFNGIMGSFRIQQAFRRAQTQLPGRPPLPIAPQRSCHVRRRNSAAPASPASQDRESTSHRTARSASILSRTVDPTKSRSQSSSVVSAISQAFTSARRHRYVQRVRGLTRAGSRL